MSNPKPADAARRASEGEMPPERRLGMLIDEARAAGMPADAALSFAVAAARRVAVFPPGLIDSCSNRAGDCGLAGAPASLLALALSVQQLCKRTAQAAIANAAYLADRAWNDADAAVEAALEAAPGLDGYADYVRKMVMNVVRQEVHAARHAANVKMRKARGEYGGGQRAFSASPVVEAAARGRLENYRIDGCRLRDLTGARMKELVGSLSSRIRTDRLNRHLLKVLSASVPDDLVAGDVLTEAQFEAAFAAAQREAEAAEGS